MRFDGGVLSSSLPKLENERRSDRRGGRGGDGVGGGSRTTMSGSSDPGDHGSVLGAGDDHEFIGPGSGSVSCESISGKLREEKNAVIDQSMKEEKKEEAAERPSL